MPVWMHRTRQLFLTHLVQTRNYSSSCHVKLSVSRKKQKEHSHTEAFISNFYFQTSPIWHTVYQNLFFLILEDISPFWALIPLFWTFGDIYPGFQSQGGFPCLHAFCAMDSWDSPLVQHLLTSGSPAWQPSWIICKQFWKLISHPYFLLTMEMLGNWE